MNLRYSGATWRPGWYGTLRVRTMHVMRILAAAALSTMACQNVTTFYPLGAEPVELDPEEWAGSWLNSSDERIHFTVRADAEGVLLATQEESGAGPERFEINVRSAAGWTYASILVDDEDVTVPEEYQWAKIKNDGELIVIWFPDAGKFKELVDRGVLPGEQSTFGLRLGLLSSEHYELIASEAEGVLFDWESPEFFRRAEE